MEKQSFFTKCVVRKPGKSFVSGLTSVDLGKPDYETAVKQHDQYVEALKSCGIEVKVLEADERFPDSTFVEDPAIVTEKCAIITRPGAKSRRDEIIEMKEILAEFFDIVEEIKEGSLEGGDVLRVENHFFIGISARTDEKGAQQLKDILAKYNYTSDFVPLSNCLHLKTGVSYLGNNILLVTEDFANNPAFKDFKKVIVNKEEAYSVNCISRGDQVIFPKGFEKTKNSLIDLGFKVIEVEVSEFEKQDGGLTCLSLRF